MKNSILLSIVALLLLLVYCIDPGQQKTGANHGMAKEQKLKLASENYLKAWSTKDSTLINAMSVPDLERNVNGKIASNEPSGLRESLKFWHTAMPDFKISALEIVVKGNRSYTRWSFTGTHTGMLGDTPPTGKKTTVEGFSILTFDEGGTIIRENTYYDLLGVMRKWGFTVVAPVME